MKTAKSAFLVLLLLALTLVTPHTVSPAPQGQSRVVTSAADSGPGTLRQALLDAQEGDTITFDSAAFPPGAPATIFVDSQLPGFHVNNLTLDASNAGVILDGSHLSGDWEPGLQIVSTHGNAIRGLQITNFSGRAIDIGGDARHNMIGGDRNIGAGPFGQGNSLILNGNGVILSTSGATLNVIAGNLIGSDAVGATPLGNGTGVWIGEGANGNTVGPDNIIAYNSQAGVVADGVDSVHNTITQNSIHDNAWWGINLSEGANDAVPFPSIFAYDLAAGTMTGATCPLCTVEIFSDAINEGAIFEGRVTADERGVFIFNKGSAFVGPYLTTTATDTNGNTSRFSAPLAEDSWAVILQTDNSLPKTQFQAKRSNQIVDNGVGTGYSSMAWWDPESYEHELNVLVELGLKQVDMTLQENEVPEDGDIDWSRDEFEIPTVFGDFVDALGESGISAAYVLMFWDKANHPDGWEGITSRFKTEEEIQRYLEFVRFIVDHFKGRIRTYKLWNEPDACGEPEQCVEPADMINLIQRAAPVIHEEDPQAQIEIPSNVIFYDRDYLFSILNSDVMPLVDVVDWETAPGGGGPTEGWSAYYVEYPALAKDIEETATMNGFSGEYWAGGILTWWSLGNPAPPLPYPASATRGAKNVIRGVVLHRGLGVGTHLAVPNEPSISRPAFQNLCTAMAGLAPFDLPAVIEEEVADLKQYAFTLLNGDYVLALWRDVEPGPDDAGVPVTVTLPGLAGYWATGIDVLHGFELQLLTSDDDESLVISNLMVKDYPILIRLAPTRYLYLPFLSQGTGAASDVATDGGKR